MKKKNILVVCGGTSSEREISLKSGKACSNAIKSLNHGVLNFDPAKKNFKVGSAKMSDIHCNFFINNGKATSKDLEELINKVKETVYKKTKTNLELEIKIIGYNN